MERGHLVMKPGYGRFPTMSSMPAGRVVLYDTTLRDGAQMQGVDFSSTDKQVVATDLDCLGIDYIEGGWPGANPTDDAFFAEPPQLRHATLTAFGMTRRPGRSMANDPILNAVLGAGTRAVCLVGKASHRAAQIALGVTPWENLDLIGDTVAEAVSRGLEVLFDAEHFFDGYRNDKDYALSCLRRAQQEGASWLILCDTNGGALPDQISAVVSEVVAALPGALIGIHTHNDTETAVAGSLAAVAAGARMIQGTLNGLGERCGNANLVSLIPSLMLKLGYHTGVSEANLRRLTEVSRMLDRRVNRTPNRYAAYVGRNAFTHKAGLHASAVSRDSTAYEHVAPELIGNRRHVVVSNQAGRANLVTRLSELGIAVTADDPRISNLLEIIKKREFAGYTYDGADASFEILARRTMGETLDFFEVVQIGFVEERTWNTMGKLATLSMATVTLKIHGRLETSSAESNDPIVALDMALRRALLPMFPELAGMRFADYRAHTRTQQENTAPVTSVLIESEDINVGSLARWSTIGAADNLIDASLSAMHDAISYRILCRSSEKLTQISA